MGCNSIKKIVFLILVCWSFQPNLHYGQSAQSRFNRIESIASLSSSEFTVAIIGDRTGEGPDPWTVFDQAVADINLKQPDFVFMVGDVIQRGGSGIALAAKWQEARSHLEKIEPPFFCIPGNHDVWNRESRDAWLHAMGDVYFHFKCGNRLFLFLNSEESKSRNGRCLGEKQMAYVRETLNRYSGSRVFVIMHRPPWLEKGQLSKEWASIEKMLTGKSFSLITGHWHVLGEKVKNGNRYLIVGPTGGKMRLARNPAMGMMQHYSWMEVKADTTLIQFMERDIVYPEQTAIDAYARGIRTLRYMMSH